jgi:hypothetical protein
MILPTKYLGEDRALLSVGATILRLLDQPKTVSRLWDELKSSQPIDARTITWNWFLLALDLLYTVRAIDYERGRLRVTKS